MIEHLNSRTQRTTCVQTHTRILVCIFKPTNLTHSQWFQGSNPTNYARAKNNTSSNPHYKLCICHANKRTITNSGLPSHKTYGIRTFENKEWPTATQKSFGHPSTVHKTRLNYSMAGSICALHPCTPQLTQHTSRAKVGGVEQRPHVLFEAPRCISAPKSTEVCDLQQHSEAVRLYVA